MQQIRQHLQRHPVSADTVEGIHAWWIEWMAPGGHISVTQLALERLQAQGIVECVRLENGREVWRRKREG